MDPELRNLRDGEFIRPIRTWPFVTRGASWAGPAFIEYALASPRRKLSAHRPKLDKLQGHSAVKMTRIKGINSYHICL